MMMSPVRRFTGRIIALATIVMIASAGVGASAAQGAAAAPANGPTATVTDYRGDVALDPDRHWLQASLTADVKLNSETTELSLLLNQALAVTGLRVGGVPAKFRRDGTRIAVELPAKAAAGDTVGVGIDYAGAIISQGWGLRGHIGSEGIFVSREAWLPCDETWSAGAISADLTVDLPVGQTLVNLGQVVRRDAETGRQRVRLLTADLNIVAGIYDYRRIITGATTVELYTYSADPEVGRILADEIPRAFAFLRRTLGEANIKSIVIVNMPAVPGFGGGVTYENLIGLVPDYRNARGSDIYSILPHELTHAWQQARLSWFTGPGELWLTEATATYVGWLYLEDRFGAERFHDAMSEGAEVYWRDRLIDGTGSVLDFEDNPRADLRYGAVYLKGAWVLHMFRQLVGEDAFARYLSQHLDWRAGSLDDWIGMCSQLAGFDVRPYFDTWLRADGSQRLTLAGLTSAPAAGGYHTTFELVAEGTPPRKTDIAFRTARGEARLTLSLTGATTSGSAILPGPPETVTIDPDRWLLLPPADRPDLTVVDGDLTIDCDPGSRSLRGTAVLTLRNELGPRPDLRLSLNTGLTVTAVTVAGETANFIQSTRDLVIVPARGIGAGETVEVRLNYQGWPVTIGAKPLPASGALPAEALWYPSLVDLTWSGRVRITVPAAAALTQMPGWQRQVSGGTALLTRESTAPATLSLSLREPVSVRRLALVGGAFVVLVAALAVARRRSRR